MTLKSTHLARTTSCLSDYIPVILAARLSNRCRIKTMKPLVVGGQGTTVDYLRQGRAAYGFVANQARNGIDGLNLAQTEGHGLVILDVMRRLYTAAVCWPAFASPAKTCRCSF